MADMNEKEIIQRFKGLRRLTPDRDAAQAAVDKARAAVMQGAEMPKKPLFKSYAFKFAVAACLVAVCIAGFAFLTNDNSTVPAVVNETEVSVTGADADQVALVTEGKGSSLEARLAELEKLFAAGDIRGLLAMLDDADEKIKIAAAGMLAKIGGAEAIKRLTELSLAFNGKGDDPYMLSIAEIEDNLKEQQAAEDKPEEEAEEIEVDRSFDVEVIDKLTQEPVAGAAITLNCKFDGGKKPQNIKEISDAEGYCLFDLGTEKLTRITVYLNAPGYIQMKAQCYDKKLLASVSDILFEVEKGVDIGGMVVDEQGQPIEGVIIDLSRSSNNSQSKFAPFIRAMDTETGKEGRWRRRVVLDDLDKIYCRFKHPDYVDDRYSSYLSKKFDQDQLLAETTVSVMVKGTYVSGYVYDSEGNAVEGASVYEGSYYQDNELSTKTDANGMFEYLHVSRSSLFLTATAEGFAPYSNTFVVDSDADPFEIILDKGSVIYGRVVDKDGVPVEGATIRNDQGSEFVPVEWSAKSDAQGRFAWENAPTQQVKISASMKGYYSTNLIFKADSEKEHEFVLYPELVVTGKVYDAITEEPINNFKVIPGYKWSQDNRSLSYQDFPGSTWVKKFNDGKYDFTINRGFEAGLKVAAEGYVPSESRTLYPDEERAEIDFYLETMDAKTKGVVYDLDGNPVEGAKVYVSRPNRWLMFENLRDNNDQTKPVVTDKDGEFSFLPEDENYVIIVLHDDKGFGEVYSEDFQKSQDIYLSKWGMVEGEAYIGSKPAANAEIVVSFYKNHDPEHANYNFSHKFRTDAEGKFSAKQILPAGVTDGRLQIYRAVKKNDRSTSSVDSKTIEVLSGETTYVVLGGGGRTVIGKMLKPAGYSEAVIWSASSGNINAVSSGYPTDIYEQVYKEIEYPMPLGYDSMTVAEVLEWSQQWSQSDEGKDFYKEIQKRVEELNGGEIDRVNSSYNAVVSDDGRFKADNVEQGDYQIAITVYKIKDRWGNRDYNNPIGKSNFKFTMPEITDDNIDEPLDVGNVAIEAISKFAVGSVLPNMELNDYKGNSVNLGIYRGKLLLLNFWQLHSAVNESQDSEMDSIKQLHDKLAGNGKIEMLGITTGGMSMSFYDDLRPKYLKEKGITFKQALIKPDQNFYQMFGQMGWPNNVLVDTNGNVIGSGLKGQELEDAVAAELAKLTPVPVE